jgi:hypothetical protein
LRKAGTSSAYKLPGSLSLGHQALPSNLLNTIALQDADDQSALQYVKAKLGDVGIDIRLSPEETKMINWLGGRASDLATVRLLFA